MASRIILAGLRGTLLDETAAAVAARLGWPLGAAPDGDPAPSDGGAVLAGWDALLEPGADAGPAGLRVLLTAPWPVRVRRIAAESGVGEREAAGLAAAEQRELDGRARRAGWAGAEDLERFDLVINTGRLEVAHAAALVAAALQAAAPAAAEPARDGRRAAPDGGPGPRHPPHPQGRVAFAHPSEEEFARVLDFYRVKWEYEPTTFPLEWDQQGRVTSAFTPDFYLPELDLYVELTTMKQSLVSRKNRKIRRLKELYPGVQIKVFYGRDYEKLLRKFGR